MLAAVDTQDGIFCAVRVNALVVFARDVLDLMHSMNSVGAIAINKTAIR
jgi:hypothetical protein